MTPDLDLNCGRCEILTLKFICSSRSVEIDYYFGCNYIVVLAH